MVENALARNLNHLNLSNTLSNLDTAVNNLETSMTNVVKQADPATGKQLNSILQQVLKNVSNLEKQVAGNV